MTLAFLLRFRRTARHLCDAVTEQSQVANCIECAEGDAVDVGMATRCRQDPSSTVHGRPENLACCDCGMDVESVTSDFTSRRHAAHQRSAQVADGPSCAPSDGLRQLGREVWSVETDEVGMTIPEARHHDRHMYCLVFEVRRRLRRWAGVGDGVGLEDDGARSHRFPSPRNEHVCVDAYGHQTPWIAVSNLPEPDVDCTLTS